MLILIIVTLFLLLHKMKILLLEIDIILIKIFDKFVIEIIWFWVNNTFISWSRLRWWTVFIIIDIFFSFFFITRRSILYLTSRLLKARMKAFFISTTSILIIITTIFYSRISAFNTILLSFNCCTTIVTVHFLLFNWWRYWLTIFSLSLQMNLLNLIKCLIHITSYWYLWWTYKC
jgi:hypothetical protein